MKRLFAGFVAIAMVLTLVGSAVAPAQAATIEELQAMIVSLQAQLAALLGGTTTGGVSCGFTRDLTVNSTGADVTCLQNYLTGTGHFNFAGGATGFFGPITQAAVAAWQAANGISPAAGYFGPISRGAYSTMMASAPTTPTTPGSTVGITTPGVEGTLTASLNPTPGAGTKVYEGDSKRASLGIKLEAKLSDIKVERIKIVLPSTTFYNKIAHRVYIMDGSTVLASMDLNSSTVVNESGVRSVTLSGMSFIVPKDSTRVLTVAFDIYGSIDSTLTDGDTFAITIPSDGVRGLDGAGISQYSPSSPSTLVRTVTPQADLVDSATLKVALNSNTPKTNEVVAAAGADEDELDEATLMLFDLTAEKDDVLVTDLTATLASVGSATASTTYLYDGSTLVGSAAVTVGTALFSDIDYTVPKGATKTLALKADVRDAATAATTFTASVTGSSQVVAENSVGDVIAATGSATSNSFIARKVGPQFSLVSKTIEKSSTPVNNNSSTSTAKGIFSVKVKAVGGDITFGTQAASTTFGFGVYKGSVLTPIYVASTTSFTTPSSGVITSGLCANCAFQLQENNEVTLPVEFLFEGRLSPTGVLVGTDTYAIGLQSIAWSSDAGSTSNSSTFMAGQLDWRTSGVSMP